MCIRRKHFPSSVLYSLASLTIKLTSGSLKKKKKEFLDDGNLKHMRLKYRQLMLICHLEWRRGGRDLHLKKEEQHLHSMRKERQMFIKHICTAAQITLYKWFIAGGTWIAQWSVPPWLRSWASSWLVWAPHRALCCQHRAHFRSSVSLSAPPLVILSLSPWNKSIDYKKIK